MGEGYYVVPRREGVLIVKVIVKMQEALTSRDKLLYFTSMVDWYHALGDRK